jgi:ParB family chromosome partitioning protein
MSKNRGMWISRRGQAGAQAAIDQVIDRQPQPGEQVQQVPNALIEDSPYQARQPFSDDSIEDLAQGMREVGFQGVLIVRPHGDLAKRRSGRFQLIYGHRRRVAWRRVCVDRGEECMLPVVVREIDDERMLTIGAQENLQRQDLDPVEEAQIVAWHERVFFDKNQIEIGALLGKSSDWVSTRSRIHRLPDLLKESLRQRPRAISQILELGAFYVQQPDAAVALANRVVQEQLTLDVVRALVRGYARPEQQRSLASPERRGTTTFVGEITNNDPSRGSVALDEERHTRRGASADMSENTTAGLSPTRHMSLTTDQDPESSLTREPASAVTPNDMTLLQEVVAALSSISSRTDNLQANWAKPLLDAADGAIGLLRRSLIRRELPKREEVQDTQYRLVGTDIGEVLAILHSGHPATITIRSAQTQGLTVRLFLCLLLPNATNSRSTKTPDIFIGVADAGNAAIPVTESMPVEWVRTRLKLPQRKAVLVAALLGDLAKVERRLCRDSR